MSKIILQKEFSPGSSAHGPSEPYLKDVKSRLESLGCYDKIATEKSADICRFPTNSFVVYSRTQAPLGTVMLEVVRDIRPYGCHEHDYFSVSISTSEENMGKLEEEVLANILSSRPTIQKRD